MNVRGNKGRVQSSAQRDPVFIGSFLEERVHESLYYFYEGAIRRFQFLTAVLLGIKVSLDVALCRWVIDSLHSQESQHFRPQRKNNPRKLTHKDEGATVIRNVGNNLSDTASHPRRLEFSPERAQIRFYIANFMLSLQYEHVA